MSDAIFLKDMELVKHKRSDFKPKSYSISINFEMTSNLKYFETKVSKASPRPNRFQPTRLSEKRLSIGERPRGDDDER